MTTAFQNVYPITVLADADLSALQFGGVQIAAGLASAATADACDGVLWNKPDAANEPAQVVVAPCRVKVRAGAAFSQDDLLNTNAAGKFITATAGQGVKAIALQAAGAADEIVQALWVGGYKDIV